MDGHRVTAATIGAAGWGVFFVWIGISLAIDIGWGAALAGIGVIALGAQLARVAFDMRPDWWGVVTGACFLAAGLALVLEIPIGEVAGNSRLASWVAPGVLIVVGIAIFVSAWTRRGAR